MSYCEIVSFKNGHRANSMEYRNAHGGAAFIWTALFDKYLKDPLIPHDSWISRATGDSGENSLWGLAKREDLPLFERAVHSVTFDYAIVDKKNFKRFAEHLRQFVEIYSPGRSVCHLLNWVEFVELCDGDFIGFYMMDVSDDLWCQYDFDKDDRHFEVYEQLEEAGAA